MPIYFKRRCILWWTAFLPIGNVRWAHLVMRNGLVQYPSPRYVSSNYNERMTQFYIIHRAYYSTTRLSRFRPGYVDKCPKCNSSTGSFFHLLWSWTRVQGFWAQVVKFLNDEMGSPIPLCPKACIFPPDPENLDSHYSYTFFVESMYYVNKVIAKTWLAHRPPSFPEWLNAVNSALPLKRWIFQHRKCPHKFNKCGTVGCSLTKLCSPLMTPSLMLQLAPKLVYFMPVWVITIPTSSRL